MNEPRTVADGVKAMLDVVSVPVTVKHRIGIDRVESYDFVRDFVGQVAEAGCQVFIVHARNAWLQGLSPKENREIPPLRYGSVYQLKQDFPHLTIAINGGITDNDQIEQHLQHTDGVMLGREAYYRPWLMTEWDARFWGDAQATVPDREAIEDAMVSYMEMAQAQDGCPWYAIARHMLGLYHGMRGARLWRQVWSDHRLKPLPPREVLRLARAALAKGSEPRLAA
jgi:tRNA-dihydrouridine synthase A